MKLAVDATDSFSNNLAFTASDIQIVHGVLEKHSTCLIMIAVAERTERGERLLKLTVLCVG